MKERNEYISPIGPTHSVRSLSWAICGYHRFDLLEGVLATILFQCLQSFLNQITDALRRIPSALDDISEVPLLVLEEVENWQNLLQVGHQSLAHAVSRPHQMLQGSQGGAHHLVVFGVHGIPDGDDELGQDGQDPGASPVQHVTDPVLGEEIEWMLGLGEAVKEQRQVVLVVQFLDVHHPLDFFPSAAIIHSDRELPAFVVSPEGGGLVRQWHIHPCTWRPRNHGVPH